MQLTIAIPTYNRNETLLRNIRLLLPQLSPNCRLLILDNCSEIPVAETLGNVLRAWPDLDIKIVRHPIGIGGDANIVRCFELCETEWLWVLSDAYPPQQDAVAVIERIIEMFPEATFLNFRISSNNRANNIRTIGLQNFVENVDDFGFVLMLSVSVFNVGKVRSNLQCAYQYSYTVAPHLVLVLMSLGLIGECHFRTEQIVDKKIDCGTNTWSILNYPGILALQELPLPAPALKTLMAHIRKEFLRHLQNYTRQSVQSALSGDYIHRRRYLHELLRFRYGYSCMSWSEYVALYFIGVLIHYPKASALLFQLIKGKDISDNVLPREF